jgi:hypothetical protein
MEVKPRRRVSPAAKQAGIDYLLRHSLQGRAALMDVTLGDDEAFTAGTVQKILEIAKREPAA